MTNKIPSLDPTIIEALRNIPDEDKYKCSPLYHEILWYGSESAVHAHLFNMAKKLIGEDLTVDDFVKKYELRDFCGELNEKDDSVQNALRKMIGARDYDIAQYKYDYEHLRRKGFKGSLAAISRDGVSLPTFYLHDKPDKDFRYFSSDYYNRFMKPEECKSEEISKLMLEREWKPKDFANPEVVENALKFARDMWQTCINGFERSYRSGIPKRTCSTEVLERTPPQPKYVTELARELILYYGGIINVANP